MCPNCVYLNAKIKELEAKIRQLESRALEDSWARSNYNDKLREESDRRIGEMGGGG